MNCKRGYGSQRENAKEGRISDVRIASPEPIESGVPAIHPVPAARSAPLSQIQNPRRVGLGGSGHQKYYNAQQEDIQGQLGKIEECFPERCTLACDEHIDRRDGKSNWHHEGDEPIGGIVSHKKEDSAIFPAHPRGGDLTNRPFQDRLEQLQRHQHQRLDTPPQTIVEDVIYPHIDPIYQLVPHGLNRVHIAHGPILNGATGC
nr:hypothetical protein GCM10010200_017740 [Actinomadura rugatobispora]